jgi:pantoate--beta-alanine ligase
MIKSGEVISSRVISVIRTLIEEKKTARIDYVAIVDPLTLKDIKRISGTVLIALAVWAGKTRLIDNMIVYG